MTGSATLEDVRAAYRLLLRREPDPIGLRHYQTLVEAGLSVDALIQAFENSDEYRQRAAARAAVVDVDCGDYFVQVESLESDFGWKIARDHTWERHIVAAVRTLLAPGDTFLDIGANVGVMSFAAARTVGPAGRVIAVEPNGANLQRLYGGIVRNGFANVRVLPFAASNRPAIFALAGGTSNTYVVESGPGQEYVQSVVLDEALAGLDRLDVVKIDIEGHEPLALEGFARTLRRFRPRLLLEFNPRCLRDHAGLDPRAVATTTFDLLDEVERIEPDGSRIPVPSAEALWAMWKDGNARMVSSGQLPDGMLHFDLLGRVRG